jgi:hypothetical protein
MAACLFAGILSANCPSSGGDGLCGYWWPRVPNDYFELPNSGSPFVGYPKDKPFTDAYADELDDENAQDMAAAQVSP